MYIDSHHMEESLASDDLIRKLCSQFDKALYTDNEETEYGETTQCYMYSSLVYWYKF